MSPVNMSKNFSRRFLREEKSKLGRRECKFVRKKCQLVFQSGCTNLYPPPSISKGNIDPRAHQHLARRKFLIFTNLVGIKY